MPDFINGKHPAIVPDPHSQRTLYAAYVDGEIHGDVFGERFVFLDADRQPLQVDDCPFALTRLTTYSFVPFCLLVRLRGLDTVTELWSTDECRTWGPPSLWAMAAGS